MSRGARSAARTYALDALNEALADAEAMRITKALVGSLGTTSAASDQNHAPHKIIATVGPASRQSRRCSRPCCVAGVDVFRLNFSHGTHESHAEAYRAIREAAADAAGRSPSCRT